MNDLHSSSDLADLSDRTRRDDDRLRRGVRDRGRGGRPARGLRPGVERLDARRLLSGPGPSAAVPPGDFNGDGLSDLAVFRPATAQWFSSPAWPGSPVLSLRFGGANLLDVPAPADYDGDGRAEPAVFRPATAEWFVSGPDGGRRLARFGGRALSDIPVPADYDGDGRAEPAVFRVATAEWFVMGPDGGYLLKTFGAPNLTDIPVPADYDGDGRAEPAVFRPATAEWFVSDSDGGRRLASFGAPNLEDVPVPGDYEGLGHAQPAVFRVATAEWFAQGTRTAQKLGVFGGANHLDVPAAAPAGALARVGALNNLPSLLVPPDVPFQRLDPAAVGRHRAFLALAARGGNPVVLLGDSILGFWNDPERGLPGASSWQERLAPLGAANFGVAGDSTQDVLWRVGNGELAGRPRVAVVAIGTNNLSRNDGVEGTFRGIARIVQEVQRVSPGTRVLLLSVLPRGTSPLDARSRLVAPLNARIATLADGARVRFLDVFPRFARSDGTVLPGLFVDGLHPSTQGYAVLGAALRPAIAAML